MLDLETLEVVFGLGIIVSPGVTLDLEHTRFLNPYLSGGRNESKNCNGFVTDPVISGQSASTLEIPTLKLTLADLWTILHFSTNPSQQIKAIKYIKIT